MSNDFIQEFIKFTNQSKSVYHTVQLIEDKLKENNYKELLLTNKWELSVGKNYYVKRNESSILAFTLPEKTENLFFKITGNHTDVPCFKIKPNCETISEGAYLRLNTETYGGPILNTWLDRPLSIAGRVFIKGESILKPKCHVVSIDRPLLVIPNLAIHQNKEVNEGVKLTKQNDMLPVIALINSEINKEGYLQNILAKELKIKKEDILDMELYLYDTLPGTIVGADESLVNASRIDNLASTYSGLIGLLESNKTNGINILACYDNEECGSETKQGADSNLLLNIMERIINCLGKSKEEFYQIMYSSFMISMDGAHAVHPARGGKTDITNKPKLNQGFAIKHSANQSYSTDGFSASVIKRLAKENNIKYQEFVNNSDEKGGSTLGPISTSHIDIDSIDLGIPMLSMHSVKETAGVEDIKSLKELAKAFYSI